MKVVNGSDADFAEAVDALERGKVVAYPAETMYGLGVDPFSPEAIEHLFQVKGRPETNPIPVIVANEAQMKKLVREVSEDARKLIDRFWPGPLSLVLPKSDAVPDVLTAGRDNICVRCPASTIARKLCERFGKAITSTSANRSGEPAVRRLCDLHLTGVAIGIDTQELEPGPPSTIVDVFARTVLREGPIEADAVAACLAE